MLKTGIFANRWWVVVGAFLGMTVNTGVIETFTFAVFLKPISEDLGIDRAGIGVAIVIASIASALAIPTFGKAIDYFGLRVVHLPMILACAGAVAALALLEPSFAIVAALFGLRGIAAAGQSPVAYSKAIAGWFDKDRGLALGIAIAGVGLGIVIMPQIASYLIAHHGWRVGFVGMGIAVVLLGFIPAVLFVREPPGRPERKLTAFDQVARGSTYREAVLRNWRFWAMSAAFFLAVVAVNGTLTQTVALLSDRGFSRAAAVSALSAAGLALTVGRLLSGWSLDRIHGSFVACFFFISAAMGIALLASGGGGAIPFAATMLCGLASGAEVDLMAFFVSRYFGLRSFGAIYGTLFALFALGNGIGPWLMGVSFVHAGSYVPMMTAFICALGFACGLLLRLGPYRYAVSTEALAVALAEKV